MSSFLFAMATAAAHPSPRGTRPETKKASTSFVSFLAAGAIASLSPGLGCVRLGVWGVASMVVGIAAGSLLGVAIFERPAA